ncbi:LA2681 family HEPN domain-containing protein [Pseudomonas shirazica]|uniref:LA2681 family HEPN domain-containing protein n=1 Tax=Pseudomonas shirazica TaxID=1940636 RepID=UPI0024535FCB|nr:LA2681 family HEPN domain-containing protein [Pseudomonas shirazica]MDH4432197.1 LA2681 family HEPN domain-containing protein [Pseudomonas shirazica]
MDGDSYDFGEIAAHLDHLTNTDPHEALRQARKLSLEGQNRLNNMQLRAATLVNAGVQCQQQDAIDDGLTLYRELHSEYPAPDTVFNLGTAIVSSIGYTPNGDRWLDHKERTRHLRSEARACFWSVAQDAEASMSARSQSWTNLANQLADSQRLSECHDARLAALALDPKNGVAAHAAARYLIYCYQMGLCSDLAVLEAAAHAKVGRENRDRIIEYAGLQAADGMLGFLNRFQEPPPRAPHSDPFVAWVEKERLTLGPTVELVDPEMGKLDWLRLPGILEREAGKGATPPPIFAMFNQMKGDFILARDLAWRSRDDAGWPTSGCFDDTLDYAVYGPATSALILAHRTAIDLLDKVAAAANHYFDLGLKPHDIFFGKIWRVRPNKAGEAPLTPKVDSIVREGVHALYGLVELADDYEARSGIQRPLKNLRNAGTHRFVVLHDLGDITQCREAAEVEHHDIDRFTATAMAALRVARSAIQMLALAVGEKEELLRKSKEGLIGTLEVFDHDWIRGRDDDFESDDSGEIGEIHEPPSSR